ncbi:hypothetical protein NDU88_003373 [Pleurodeles waltl]|uniref:Uncharacterized protein n=1 Tax=Pleurodeles waltl TaxID=8319 RepID=A0AAV7RI12_PLEWA|nr:hypothetical protein NDU88_003373 [Pleurodeles waltl]
MLPHTCMPGSADNMSDVEEIPAVAGPASEVSLALDLEGNVEVVGEAAFRAWEVAPLVKVLPVEGHDKDIKWRFVEGFDLVEIMQHLRDNLGFASSAQALVDDYFFFTVSTWEPESLTLLTSIRHVVTN